MSQIGYNLEHKGVKGTGFLKRLWCCIVLSTELIIELATMKRL